MANKTKQRPKKSNTKKASTKKSRTRTSKPAIKNTKLDKATIKAIAISITCALLVFALIFGAFTLHKSDDTAPIEIPNVGENTKVLRGVDVSVHNGKIDWKKLSKDADFAIIRVGYSGFGDGSSYKDKKAKTNLKEAKKAGMPVGVYYYSQATTPKEAEREAEFLLDHIKGYRVTLPVFIDFEYAERGGHFVGKLYNAKLSKSQASKVCAAFCKKVKKAGYRPGVYASSYFYKSKISAKAMPKDTIIWVADYNDEVTYHGKYDIWQYSENGSCDGIKGKTDVNYWYLDK